MQEEEQEAPKVEDGGDSQVGPQEWVIYECGIFLILEKEKDLNLTRRDGSFTNSRGLKIYTSNWIPSEPRCVIFLSHGLGEHSHRYFNLIPSLIKQQFCVLAMDHQGLNPRSLFILEGHGRSEGKRGTIEDFHQFSEDFLKFMDLNEASFPELPKILLGFFSFLDERSMMLIC
jgi:alpha-beta hydrolase superfamily lysophospholipase